MYVSVFMFIKKRRKKENEKEYKKRMNYPDF
jgi:hypothetical protein